jgi:hypothetical protein
VDARCIPCSLKPRSRQTIDWDLKNIEAAKSKVGGLVKRAAVPIEYPPPTIDDSRHKKECLVTIPRVRNAFYKMPQDQVTRYMSPLLFAEVRHFATKQTREIGVTTLQR